MNKGFDLNKKNYNKRTFLHYGVILGKMLVVQFLVNNHANVNELDIF